MGWLDEAISGLASLFSSGGGEAVGGSILTDPGVSSYSGGWDAPVDSNFTDIGTVANGGVVDPQSLQLENLDTGGVNDTFAGKLNGGTPSAGTLSQLSAAGSQNNADAIARAQAAVAAGGQPDPQDLRTIYSNFGTPATNSDLGLGRFSVPTGSGGSGGGSGGGGVNISAPSMPTPSAERIGALATPPAQTGSVMIPSQPSTPFTPVVAQDPAGGLERLFQRGR